MGFTSSLGNVIANGKNFKQWEQENEDKMAKREALANKKPLSQQELEQARKKGKVLIDVVDVMDAHSEDVAENVETATSIPQGIIPYAAFFLSFLISGKTIVAPAIKKISIISDGLLKDNAKDIKKWQDVIQDKIKEMSLSKDLKSVSNNEHLKISKLKNIKFRLGHSLIGDHQIKDLENMGLDDVAKGAKKLLKDYTKKVKGPQSKMLVGVVIPFAAMIAGFAASVIGFTKLQVNSSRVARWQSREKLKDPKYFVQYNEEQIAQAKENLEAQKGTKKKTKKDKASIIKVIQDNKKYKEWKKQDKDSAHKVSREITSDELDEAKRDKDVIQRITKQINNKAEDYSENMETAADVFIVGTPILGGSIGVLAGKILNKLGLGDKISKSMINKFLPDVTEESSKNIKEALDNLANFKEGEAGYKGALRNLSVSILMSSYKEEGITKFQRIVKTAKKTLLGLGSSATGRNKLLAVMTGIPVTIAGLLISLKLQKSSARAGRFVAKREIENNPQNFIGYTEEEYNSVKDVKAQKETFGKKLGEYLTFIPRVMGDYFNYKKHVKTEGKERKQLLDELVKLDVSETQLKDAKDYQRKIFNTFEKVDDGSQEYSESMEAATTIAKPVALYSGMLLAVSPIIIGGINLVRGKLTGFKAIDKVSGFFAKHTDFLKGKTVSKYLDNVSSEMSYKILDKIGTKAAIKTASEAEQSFNTFKFAIDTANLGDISSLKKGTNSIIDLIIEQVKNADEKETKTIINKLVNKIQLPFVDALFDAEKTSAKELTSILENIQKVINNTPDEKITNILSELKSNMDNHPEEFKKYLAESKIYDIFATKGLKKAVVGAGLAWGGFTIGSSYLIVSILADLQKKAGRLGVMKGLEKLNDPMYYADSEPAIETEAVAQAEAKAKA